MQCPQCEHDNPPQSKFCLECGIRLALRCPSCNAELPGGARFCNECGKPVTDMTPAAAPAAPPPGPQTFTSPETYTPKHLAEKILTSKSALEGERKQVTVLFADVSGFTSLSEQVDPEDVHALMRKMFELMLGEVHRYEGTVNQFLGDGIMALFGAPIAHEDHAHRALRAALGIRKVLEEYQAELQQKRGVRFQMRQGLNTGLVVVGSIGNDLRMDYTAVGDTTNVAARLQQTADPGRIVIAEATHRLIDGYFHTRPLGPLALKGKAESVDAWEVISARAARTRLDVEVERGLTQFVSRERELRVLMEAFEQAKTGEGQVVFITGEPGIGKSRLLHEFHRRISAEATWVEGRSMSFGQSIAFHPLIDLIKRSFRIEEGDNEGAMIKKIQHSVLLLGEDLRPTLPYIRYFLSVDPGDQAVATMEPRQRRAGIFEAVRQLTLRAAEVRPQVVLFEDLQWMDKTTEEYLLFIADSVPTNRLLLLLTYRPGYTHPFGERTYHSRIALNTLSQKDSVEMVKAVLAAGSLPEDLITLIVHKAEGNPFYAEEVVKSLQELGVIRRSAEGGYVLAKRLDEIVIPDTIQGVIMSRIDRLDDAPKKTLQLASVIGREFTRRLLDRIAEIGGRTDEFVRELKAIELIYDKSGSPELAYMFKHALTHDVAYNSLLIQRRKDLHGAIGSAIEELYAQRLAEHYEVLAHHFSKAEVWAKALEYLTKAAEKAVRAFANLEAVALYDQALVALSHLEENRETIEKAIDLRFGLRNALHPLGEFGRYVDRLHEARDLADGLGDRTRLGWALAYLTHGYALMGDHERAIASGEGALVEPVGELGIRVVAGLYLGAAYHYSGDYPQAIDCYRRTLASLEGQPVQERFGLVALASVLTRGFFAMSLGEVGQFAEGRAHGEEAVRIAEAANHPYSQIWAKNFLGYLYLRSGDPAIEILKHAVALCIDTGTRLGFPFAASYLGSAYAHTGRLDEAISLLEQAVDAAVPMRLAMAQALRLSLLGEAYLYAGRTADALESAERALALSREHKERGHEAWTLRLLGEIHRSDDPPKFETAEAFYRQAIALADKLGMRPLAAHCQVGLARLYQRAGDRKQAQTHRESASQIFREIGAESWLKKAETELGAQ